MGLVVGREFGLHAYYCARSNCFNICVFETLGGSLYSELRAVQDPVIIHDLALFVCPPYPPFGKLRRGFLAAQYLCTTPVSGRLAMHFCLYALWCLGPCVQTVGQGCVGPWAMRSFVTNMYILVLQLSAAEYLHYPHKPCEMFCTYPFGGVVAFHGFLDHAKLHDA